jgi:acyl-CoA thioesterase
MTSSHPDFAGVDGATMTDADMLRHFNDNRVEPTRLLNGEFLSVDSERGTCRSSFEIVPAFCHSQGAICQGGFLTGMIDIAMAHAAIAKGRLACAVPTLELKISFLEAVGPGTVFAEGRVLRWGGSVGFLEGDLRDDKGRLIVHATCTVKIVRPKKAIR